MENEKPILRGELALMAAIVINSFSVVLMLYSDSGISAISSVPYAFSEVFKELSLGTWTYIFQGALVLSLMILRRKFVPSYLFSFVAGFAFSELLEIIDKPYARVKAIFDVLCLATTGLLTCLMLGYLDGLGIGTIVAAFTMGKMVSITGSWIDQRVTFASVLSKQTI
nr:DUF6198 family protein [uncultured Anaerostipes sp.]